MRITILTVGTWGDIVPLMALGLGLQKAGHQVQLATHDFFNCQIVSRGLAHYPIAGNPQEINRGEFGQVLLESGENPLTFIRQYERIAQQLLQQLLADSWEACQGTEAIVAAPFTFWGYDIAEKLDVPFYLAALLPLHACRDFPIPTMPAMGGWPWESLYNQLSYPLMRLSFWQLLRGAINQWRQSTLNLPPLSPCQEPLKRMERVPFLYAYSREIVPRPPHWPPQLHVTGYWFWERPFDWEPPRELVEFLGAGPPPVCIGFGSMQNRDPQRMTTLVLAALAQTGQRGILLTGWGGLIHGHLPDTVFQLDYVPHDWLFPQVAAVVHHGGMGTTAAALRAGVPAIIVPFFADQPFWGRRLAQLHLAPRPIPQQQLTAARLAAAIRTAINDRDLRGRVRAIGRIIQAEDGVGRAVEAFHQFIN